MAGRIGFLLSLCWVLTAGTRAADWPQFMGADQNGVCAETGLMKTWPGNGPEQLWSAEVGNGYGGVAVVGNEVFLLDRILDKKDALRCLGLADGKELWRYEYDAPGRLSHDGSRSTPTVTEKHVYTIGPHGHVKCIDRSTHKPVWDRNVLEEFDAKKPRWGVAQSAVLYEGSVVITPMSAKAGVVALDQATGKERWRSPGVTNLAYVTPRIANLAGADQLVTIGAWRMKPKDGKRPRRGHREFDGKPPPWVKLARCSVIGVAADDGRLLWTYSDWHCANPIPMPFPVGDDRILITGGYFAGSVMLKIGREADDYTVSVLWKNAELGSQIAYPVLHEDHLYMICNGNFVKNGLACLDLDGKTKWKTGKDPELDRGHLLPAEGLIYTLDGAKGLLRLIEPSPNGYKEIARKKVFSGPELWSPLTIAGGRLFVRGPKVLSCLDVRRK